MCLVAARENFEKVSVSVLVSDFRDRSVPF